MARIALMFIAHSRAVLGGTPGMALPYHLMLEFPQTLEFSPPGESLLENLHYAPYCHSLTH